MNFETAPTPKQPEPESLEHLDEVAATIPPGDKKGLRGLAMRMMEAGRRAREKEDQEAA